MKDELQRAIELLKSGAYTCVMCGEDKIYTGTERGVKPLLEMLDNGTNLKGFSAADKVVGKAAAFLYVMLEVYEVYAPVMSEGAFQVLEKHGAKPHCDKLVKGIINRSGTGPCPMEDAVRNITEPLKAVSAIKARLKELNEKNK